MDRKEVYTVRGRREGGEDERGWENCGLMESVGLERECKKREGEGGGGQRDDIMQTSWW